METTIMLSHTKPQRIHHHRMLGVALGLTAMLLVNSGDRTFLASSDNQGIDPLQVLDTQPKNNILFMVSTSDSLAGTPQAAGSVVGGDDPASRLYQMKRALRTIISENQGKADFGVATFHPEVAEHVISDTSGLVYVSQDPSANNYLNKFNRTGGSVLSISPGISAIYSGNNVTSFSTGSYTPATNALLVTLVTASDGADPTSVTGHGLSYTKFAATSGLGTSGSHQMSVWVAATGSSPNADAVQADFAGNTTPILIAEFVVAGADLTSGATGAFAQRVVSSGTGTEASTTLAPASNPGNAAMYFVVHNEKESTTPKPGWTEAFDSGSGYSRNPDNGGVEVQYNLAFSTAAGTASPGWSTFSAWAGLALEIKVAPTPTLRDACSTPGACSTTDSSAIFDLFQNNDGGTSTKYPSTCTDQATDRVSVGGTVNSPLTHTLGTNCRYYIRSKIRLNGMRYTVNRSASAASAITTSAAIPGGCPAPAPGLLGDDTLAASDGTKNRACFQLQDVTPTATNRITTYWLTGTQFKYSTVTTPVGTPAEANEAGINVQVADCDGTDNTSTLQDLTRLELQYDSSGLPLGINSLTDVAGLTPTTTNAGIRLGTGSPIANSLTFALNYFRTTVLPAAGTTKRPIAAQGKQKQFVILIADADDTYSTLAQQKDAAYALWSNNLPTLPSCTTDCGTLGDLTAAQWAAANRIELIVVPFGVASTGLTQATMDALAAAGSGMNPANTTCDSGGSCRTAPIATTYSELLAALRKAIYAGSGTGTFSDQQSVTETLFEFASLATPSKDPLDPYERYAVAIPVLLQSTFELPDFRGHLNAVRRNNAGTVDNPDDDYQEVVWDAGAKLYDRVSIITKAGEATLGLGRMDPSLAYSFTALYGDGTTSNIKTSTALIRRRIYTTRSNGVNANYNVTNLLSANFASLAGSSTGFQRVPLWPPTTSTTTNTSVAPTTTWVSGAAVKGILDSAMGFDAWTTVAQVQAAVPGACQGTVTADIHADCTSATAGLPLARAKREAREIILAFIAGARVRTANDVPVRSSSTKELQYEVRPWIMVESTLASPGVVTPPLLAGPASGGLGATEYGYYRDGVRDASTLVPYDGVLRGLGLRNPDRLDTSAAQSLKDAAAADLNLKPSMSVVYHSTNQGLHAFRAGPCPTPPAGSGISAATIPCSGEGGGEELWAFVPYDLLYKLPALTIPQTRATKQYLLAAPVRFSDVFVPGSGSWNGATFTGVWRTLLYFGRGQGGKYLTALDVTTPGPFTNHSLGTTEPIVVWSRGNPDTSLGILTGAGGIANNSTTDYTAYLKMGETWSVPALAYVNYADWGTNFVLFTGSGYSDVLGEGKTFFALNALNGNVLRSFDIADNSSVPVQSPILTNFLVASPVGYGENDAGDSPAGYRYLGNPLAVKTSKVYFGDLHSRIWRYDVTTPASAPTVFYQADIAAVGNQPFATPLSVLQNRPDASIPGDILVFAEAGHDRRVALNSAKPFKAYALKESGSVGEVVFTKDFPTDYRGTVQPASAFAATSTVPTPVVFYAGITFDTTYPCTPIFNSILMALKATTSFCGAQSSSCTATTPDAAFDLRVSGDDSFIELAGTKIQAIRVSGEGSLVVDQGLSAQNVPPPPGVPVPTEVIPGTSGVVRIGLTPGTQDYKDLAPTTVPYRVGSGVCRTQ